MSHLREHATERQRLAHRLLDLLRAGVDISAMRVRWALVCLGEPVERA